MSALLDVILPVFVVIGFGYALTRMRIMDETVVDALMRFAQNFAVPVLLFRSIAHLDLSSAYDTGLMVSFYSGAFLGFAACFAGVGGGEDFRKGACVGEHHGDPRGHGFEHVEAAGLRHDCWHRKQAESGKHRNFFLA